MRETLCSRDDAEPDGEPEHDPHLGVQQRHLGDRRARGEDGRRAAPLPAADGATARRDHQPPARAQDAAREHRYFDSHL